MTWLLVSLVGFVATQVVFVWWVHREVRQMQAVLGVSLRLTASALTGLEKELNGLSDTLRSSEPKGAVVN